MIKTNNTNRGGLVRTALIILVILIVLAYFGLNLRGIVASTTFQDNWHYISGIAVSIWEKYLRGVLSFIWLSIVIPILNKIS